jgi:8-oxo-dGTP pyrophosphatase MutT (NUDIX family)
VLLRPTAARFEVLMIRRHDQVAFMGGAHVFPGGSVDDDDRRVQPEAIGAVPAGHQAAAVRELAEEAAIVLPLDALIPFARWITPAIETKRYDVWFFVARAPDGQQAAHDAHEAVDSVWIVPSEAIEQCRHGDIALPPPTWTTLRTLERFKSVDEVMAWARTQIVSPIQPTYATRDGVDLLTMPEQIESERQFVLRDGRWQPLS